VVELADQTLLTRWARRSASTDSLIWGGFHRCGVQPTRSSAKPASWRSISADATAMAAGRRSNGGRVLSARQGPGGAGRAAQTSWVQLLRPRV